MLLIHIWVGVGEPILIIQDMATVIPTTGKAMIGQGDLPNL